MRLAQLGDASRIYFLSRPSRLLVALFLEAKAETAEGVDVGGAARDAYVAAALELKIFRHGKGDAQIDRAHPIQISFRADTAEEFAIRAEPGDDLASKRDRIDKFLVITSANFIPQKADSSFHSHLDLTGQIDAERKESAPSTASLPNPLVFVGNFTNGGNANAVGPRPFPQRLIFKRVRKSPTPDKVEVDCSFT